MYQTHGYLRITGSETEAKPECYLIWVLFGKYSAYRKVVGVVYITPDMNDKLKQRVADQFGISPENVFLERLRVGDYAIFWLSPTLDTVKY